VRDHGVPYGMAADASTFPLPAERTRRYYGWWVLLVAAAAMVGTLPGRTQGLGLITEALLADFHLDRVTFASLNFWATVIGSLGAIGVGPLLDRLGSRLMLAIVVVAVGLAVWLTSAAQSFAVLAIGIASTRALGQSALSVVSLAVVGQWFVRRIDRAMAVYSVLLSVGFMMAFPLVGAMVQQWGWRQAWASVGAWLIVALAPLGWIVVRRSPESIGLQPDGADAPVAVEDDVALEQRVSEARDYTWGEALRTPAFWVFALGAALYGLVASGIGLFNESILAERGFGPSVYYQTLVVTALTALAGNFGGGWLGERVAPARMLAVSLSILAAGLLALPHVASTVDVMIWAAAMGIGGGIVMVQFFSIWPRAFGRSHLGRIQGSAQALTVLASALGPLLLAWCVEATGSYAMMFRVLAAVIAGLAATALAVDVPSQGGVRPTS
jgi:MFS family permease